MREVLKLHQHVGPAALHRREEVGHEFVVFFLADTLVPPAHVHGVIQQLLVIGSHVQHDRQGIGRADTATGGVQGQFANGNAHATDALVSQPENALAVGHHNHFDPFLGGAAQQVVQVLAVRVGDKQAAMVAVNVGELLAGIPHGRGVDDREHFLQMVFQQSVKQGFIVVLDRPQCDVAVEIVLAEFVLFVGPLSLLLDGFHMLWQQADQVEIHALPVGKGTALIQQRHLQQRGAGVGDV